MTKELETSNVSADTENVQCPLHFGVCLAASPVPEGGHGIVE